MAIFKVKCCFLCWCVQECYFVTSLEKNHFCLCRDFLMSWWRLACHCSLFLNNVHLKYRTLEGSKSAQCCLRFPQVCKVNLLVDWIIKSYLSLLAILGKLFYIRFFFWIHLPIIFELVSSSLILNWLGYIRLSNLSKHFATCLKLTGCT